MGPTVAAFVSSATEADVTANAAASFAAIVVAVAERFAVAADVAASDVSCDHLVHI